MCAGTTTVRSSLCSTSTTYSTFYIGLLPHRKFFPILPTTTIACLYVISVEASAQHSTARSDMLRLSNAGVPTGSDPRTYSARRSPAAYLSIFPSLISPKLCSTLFSLEKSSCFRFSFFFQEILTRPKNTLHFIKLHAPWNLLCRYAEELNLRAPIQVRDQNTVVGPWMDALTALWRSPFTAWHKS